jgi:hypothetical protein
MSMKEPKDDNINYIVGDKTQCRQSIRRIFDVSNMKQIILV